MDKLLCRLAIAFALAGVLAAVVVAVMVVASIGGRSLLRTPIPGDGARWTREWRVGQRREDGPAKPSGRAGDRHAHQPRRAPYWRS